MSRGWIRLGIVLSLAWIVGVSGVALYEWQAPFYRKGVFFMVVPHPEQAESNGVIPVTTPFLYERFIAVVVLPPAALWALLLVGPSISWVRRGFRT